jgi:hypothetical protein
VKRLLCLQHFDFGIMITNSGIVKLDSKGRVPVVAHLGCQRRDKDNEYYSAYATVARRSFMGDSQGEALQVEVEHGLDRSSRSCW